jgi:2-oxoglutarate/2-oxoacid ferredoxin oxidoreductase subunit alpha
LTTYSRKLSIRQTIHGGAIEGGILDYTIKIGGEAGQGVETVSSIIGKLLARLGYFVFTHQDYESRVRGGHNFFQIRFSDRPVAAPRDVVDILVAFDRQSIPRHENEVAPHGMIIFDGTALKESHEGDRFLQIPFSDLAVTQGGNRIMANTVATGAVMGILGVASEALFSAVRDSLKQKGEEIVTGNLNAAKAGYEYAARECATCAFVLAPPSEGKMLIAGNDAIGMGAVTSGCKFYSAYPMTPSTGIFNYVAGKANEYGIVVEQAEDEIAAINMAVGASFAGVRSMVGTSGGGFALMVEGLSLAGMTETPLVIALAQRPGPATGLPTRTEQSDLLFALYAGHGEFPRVIFAPGSPEQALYLTNKAFHLAEKYQIPAFVITDQYLADSEWTYKSLDLTKIQRYTDFRVRGDAFRDLKTYSRHAFTETGVSPLGIPGDGSHVVVTDSDEHTEDGHITEDAGIRRQMVEKRLMRKLPLITGEMEPPLLYGEAEPDIVLVGWGSTYGVIREAVDRLSETKRIAMLHFSEIYPFPLSDEKPMEQGKGLDYLRILKEAKLTVCIENNSTGKFASLFRTETGYVFDAKINRFDGRPFTLENLIGEINVHAGRL